MNSVSVKHEIGSQIRNQIDAIKRGCVELIKEDELYEKLLYSTAHNLPLKIKAGFDPTAPDIHLGHTVLLNKLRTFQEYGHQVFFIIGDFTAMIGDPTGKSETRKPLSEEDVLKNSKDYRNQAFKILKPEKTTILFNSWWLSNIKLDEFIKISSNYTVRRMLEKDDFEKRLSDNSPISMHEFIYPLLQGFDSLFLKSDIEIGGNDQKFNLIVGRELMKSFNVNPQVIMTMPLLEGLDGKNKMSKSLGNQIGVSDEPNEMFGKIMSISDEMMIKYYELLSSICNADLNILKKEINEGMNPILAKKKLALEIVRTYHGQSLAEKASKYFEEKFQKRINPGEINTIELNREYIEKYVEILPQGVNLNLISLLTYIGVIESNSEAKRLIKQGAVKIDLESNNNATPIRLDSNYALMPLNTKEFIIKIGKKKIYKIKLNSLKKA
ncbi:MAG: tyrosine--tRNA ligase [Deltaproteobacteria bacterium]|nr:tyrosine--tRNA ligase [Deltaproteobacteria bacterium]